MSINVGILGVGGYGGGEALRLCAGHPQFRVVYASGESSAGKKLVERFPGVHPSLANLTIEHWNDSKIAGVDLLFASLPSGGSKEPLARVPGNVKIVDIGGDHRYADGWTYGLADIWPEKIKGQTRIANPGCYPSAALTAIAPLLSAGMVETGPIIIDAKSGVSGAGRGGPDSKLGFADVNEDVSAYKLLGHAHVPEMTFTVGLLGQVEAPIVFTPHLIPMTRGILATCYLRGTASTHDCLEAARRFYADRSFVRVVEHPPHTKWALGSNLAFVSYASNAEGMIIAMGAIDNLGKGAAGQAVQNANIMFDLPPTSGLEGSPLWP